MSVHVWHGFWYSKIQTMLYTAKRVAPLIKLSDEDCNETRLSPHQKRHSPYSEVRELLLQTLHTLVVRVRTPKWLRHGEDTHLSTCASVDNTDSLFTRILFRVSLHCEQRKTPHIRQQVFYFHVVIAFKYKSMPVGHGQVQSSPFQGQCAMLTHRSVEISC